MLVVKQFTNRSIINFYDIASGYVMRVNMMTIDKSILYKLVVHIDNVTT